MDPVTIVAGFLRAFWREALILALAVALWGTHEFYYSPKIENLSLQLEVERGKLSQCQTAFNNQSNKLIEESENTNKLVTEGFERLEQILNDLSDKEQQQIDDIINQPVPESCDELNQFLIDMVERLRWNQ
jgi:hypothetical protein